MTPTVGAPPIVIRLAVMVLVNILLVVSVLAMAASMITFVATKTIFPEVVANWPEVFVIVLVAIRFVRYIEPVDMEPPVLSMVTLDMLKLVTLSATKLLVTFS